MTYHPLWSDDYRLLLMQLFLRKPTGIKPIYSKGMVELALELHLPPRLLYERMFELRRAATPQTERLWQVYGDNPRRLARDVKTLRRMRGFGSNEAFYNGVGVRETFERDFRPIALRPQLTPMMLILVLDLYFRLTPATMVRETPEVIELAKMMRIKPELVEEVMTVFQACDPYLKRDRQTDSPLMDECRNVWNRFGNDNPEQLAALAAQLKDYFA